MTTNKSWFHAHCHSEFSSLDAISEVETLVEKAAKMGQPAIALTDHGNMSGVVKGYLSAKKNNIQFFPGIEGYLTSEPITGKKEKLERYHIGMLALNQNGYKQLVQLTTKSHTRPRFNRFPRFDLNDFAEFSSEDIAISTGCFFGLVQQSLVHKGYDRARNIVEMYAKIYKNTFVEIQNHNISHVEQDSEISSEFESDDDICEAMVSIADSLGLPVIATQDSHYCDGKQKAAHELMKRMVYRGEGSSNEFPGDSFHLASSIWVEEHHDPTHWSKALEGSKELLSLNDVEFPELDNYRPRIPTVKKRPQVWLEREFWKRLKLMHSDGVLTRAWSRYEKQGKHELKVIEKLGQAGYFSVVDIVIDFCKQNEYAFEARGSANSSLVCYALGITSVDPIEFGLTFERFLSLDRKKPPDIDIDVEDVARPHILGFIDRQFGTEQIGTFQALGARDNDDKGNLLVSYNSYLRDKLGNDKFIPMFGAGIETIEDVKNYSRRDHKGLRQLSKLKVKRSYGVHPSGLLLNGDDLAIKDNVPLMLVASSNTPVSQFSGEDVEKFGYLKLDLLGQRTLTIMRRCQELIGIDNPSDFKWIPKNDKQTTRYLSRGNRDNGVFQFEGYAMAKGAKNLRIKSTMDCVLAGALFRPACMDSGVTDTYIDRRRNPWKKENLEFPHPAFEEVLSETNGVVLFQEQVLSIMRKLGLDYVGINKFFDIVKDSGKGATERNSERIKEVNKQWLKICEDNNIDDPDAAWHFIEGYVKYGFNKAHSSGYGVRSYRAAYLKVNYPLEYHAALLESWAGTPKENIYINEARKCGVRLLSPDVNISGANWTIDTKRSAIRRGLRSIRGIGEAASNDIASNSPFDDIEDMIERCNNRTVSGAPKFLKEGIFSGNLEKLKNAGALSSLGIAKTEDYA